MKAIGKDDPVGYHFPGSICPHFQREGAKGKMRPRQIKKNPGELSPGLGFLVPREGFEPTHLFR